MWLGLGIVTAAIALFLGGSSISWIAVAPAKWSDFSHLAGHFSENVWRYVAQFAFFATVFSLMAWIMKRNAQAFIPSFGFVYVLSAAALTIGNWSQAQLVLLGATLPFTLIVWAGPVAILQASTVSLVTFFVIFFVARKLGLNQRLAAVLGAGGAVCGVSASIAVAGAVRARKEDPPIAITLVVLWAIVLIFALPLVSRLTGFAFAHRSGRRVDWHL